MTANYTVAHALAAALKRHGVEWVFGQSIPSALFMALPGVGIRQVGYRTENAGGIMADGYARISHKVGIVTAQNGPAATLLVPPLAEALKASVPILAIVQDVPRAMVDKNAFQEFDHIALFHGCTKWARRVDRADRLDDYLDMAFTAAASGRPGPVALMVPMDALREASTEQHSRRANLGTYPLDRCCADPARIAEAAEVLATAQRPLIIAGGGVHLADAAQALTTFAEATSIPVATTNMGKGSIAETHALALGVFGNCMGAGTRAAACADYLTSADAVLLVGTRTNQNATDTWKLYPRTARYIHIDIDPLEVGRNYEALRLVGDARSTLTALTAALVGRRSNEAAAIGARTEAARASAARALHGIGTGADAALRPEYLMSTLDPLLHADDIVVTDASYATNWVMTYLSASHGGQRFLTPRGLAGLGWGVPLAIGAKLARPRARVIAVVGDGGFGHCWQELETVSRMGISITIILLNNAILGYQYHAENVHYGQHSDAVRFAAVDHAAIARACGCSGVVVDVAADFAPALRAALQREGTTLIEVMTDEHAYPPLSLFEGQVHERVTLTRVVA